MRFWKSYICSKQVGCVRNRLPFLTAQQNLKLSLWTRELRLDGLLALELWDLIVSVLGNISRISDRTEKPVNGEDKHHKSYNKIDAMQDIDSVLSNVQSARQEAFIVCV